MKNLSRIGSGVFIVLAFAASFFAYSHVPDLVATHWNAAGEVNGHMSKTVGLFFVPVLMVALMGIILGLLQIDPLKKNIQEMKGKVDALILCLMTFIAYVHSLTLAWNMGFHFDFGRWMIPPFAILFFVVGTLIKDAKPNWLMGIRTPWTLSDDVVWKETHLFGAKLFQGAGIIMLLGVVIPSIAIYLIVVTVFVAAFGSVIFSYTAYAKRHPQK